MEKTFKPSGSRMMGQYLNPEYTTLARLNMVGFVEERNLPDNFDKEVLVSLERFKLADYGSVYEGTKWVGWGWAVSEKGAEFLASLRPRRYGCRCEHAIVTPCVCSESTFCPNPEHSGNGCHGTHD